MICNLWFAGDETPSLLEFRFTDLPQGVDMRNFSRDNSLCQFIGLCNEGQFGNAISGGGRLHDDDPNTLRLEKVMTDIPDHSHCHHERHRPSLQAKLSKSENNIS